MFPGFAKALSTTTAEIHHVTTKAGNKGASIYDEQKLPASKNKLFTEEMNSHMAFQEKQTPQSAPRKVQIATVIQRILSLPNYCMDFVGRA
jgi:hypothetical protein